MDYYSILGVDRNADQDTIKKAYRSLASKHHPDKGGDTKKFQEIQAAYDILSDPDKRSQYDNPNPFGQSSNGNWQGFNQGQGFPGGFEQFFGPNLNDFFNTAFGQRRPQSRNRHINLETQISLEDSYLGGEVVASYKLGNGVERAFEVKIPRGISDGTTLRIQGAGENIFTNMPSGDALITVRVKPHPRFQRQHNDLIEMIEVPVWDLILGKSIDVKTISGETLNLTIKEGTQPDAILRLPGYGMPDLHTKIRGHHLIYMKVIIPNNLTEYQKTTLKTIIP